MWSAIFRRNQVNDAVIPNNKINVLERMKKVRNSCFNLRINMAWPQAKMLGPWRTALDKVTLDVSKSKFVTFSLARFGRFEPPCAHNRPMKDEEPTKTFCENTDFQHCDFQLFTPKKSKDRFGWGHAIAVVVQRGSVYFQVREETARNGVFDSLASLLSSASV